MRLTHLDITGFRGLPQLAIEFEDELTILVGCNGAGKSSVLAALEWLLEGGKLSASDVHTGHTGPVTVKATFGGLTAADREALGVFSQSGTLEITRRVSGAGEQPEVVARLTGTTALFDAALQRGKLDTYREPALADLADVGAPEPGRTAGALQSAARQALLTADSVPPSWAAQEVSAAELLAKNGGLRQRFEFILLPAGGASKDADTAWHSLQRLTDMFHDKAATASAMEEAHARADKVVDRAWRQAHKAASRGIQRHAAADLRRVLPDAALSFDPPARAKSMARKGDTLLSPLVRLNGFDGEPRRHGHGVERAVVIALAQALAAKRASSDSNGDNPAVLVAIEEPELYQHPTQARVLSNSLGELAARPGFQVAYSTHSPLFTPARRIEAVRRLHRDHTRARVWRTTRGALLHSWNLKNTPTGRTKALTKLSPELAEAFFARAVLLVEGPSEIGAFSAVAERLRMNLDEHGVVILNAGGITGIPRPLALLRQLGIPCFAVFDGDRGQVTGPDGRPTRRRAGWDPRSAEKAQTCRNDVVRITGDAAATVTHDHHEIAATWCQFEDELEEAYGSGRARARAERIAREQAGSPSKTIEYHFALASAFGRTSLPPVFGEIIERVVRLAD